MKAVLYTYLPISTPKDVEAERAECERIALEAGCEIIGHIHDEPLDRTNLNQFLETAIDSGIDAIVVTSIDRLDFNQTRADQVVEQLSKAGTKLITPHPIFDYVYQKLIDAIMEP
ncbi:recombinase family protein [Actinomycetaceae bacterium MB13-C1-2]|nr:recombinase family protein [Actinomycetaceae bacterium MB13-C1-2]